ncbi:unnamed protein product, partial [Prorocentrum cordatum]
SAIEGAMWGVRARGSRQRGRSMKRPPGSDEVDGERRGVHLARHPGAEEAGRRVGGGGEGAAGEEERVARGGALKDLSPQGGCTALHSPTKLAMAISARIAMFGANESPSRASVRTVLVPPVAASAPGRLPPRCAHGARQNSWTKKKHSPSN